MKKKIFFLINSLEMGGAERVLSEITPALSKKYEIRIYTLKDSKPFYDIKVKIIPLTTAKSNLSMLLSFPIAVKNFRRIMKQEQPHRVISFLELSNFVNILSNDEAIVSLRTSFHFLKGVKGEIYKHYIRKLYPEAKLIIVNSKENKEELAKNIKIDLKKIIVIRNSIDTSKIQKLRKERIPTPIANFIKNKKVFITIGRMLPEKHQDKIIEGFNSLITEDPLNALIILGDGPMKNQLEKKIIRSGLTQSVQIISGENNVFKYLNHANYFIYASEAEGFPNVLLEAMTIGLPIITTDFKTGARELVDPSLPFDKKLTYPYYGPNGVLIPLENFKEKFLNSLKNKNLRQKKQELFKYKKDVVLKSWDELIQR